MAVAFGGPSAAQAATPVHHARGRNYVPEIVTPRWRRARHDGVVVHETTVLSADDVTGVDGIPVTTPARTLVDAAAVLHPSTLDIAVDEALRRDLVTFDALWTRVAELGGRGRAGTAHLRAFLAARHPDADLSESVRETLLVDALVAANLPRPVLQQEIRDRSGTFVARVDAAYPHARVALSTTATCTTADARSMPVISRVATAWRPSAGTSSP